MPEKNPKLHELLAVDRDLELQAKKIAEEAVKVFKDKPNLFLGSNKRLEMFDEERKNEEAAAEQHISMTTTVPEKLEYIRKSLVAYIDATAQKERTNQDAKADVILSDGTILLTEVPATLLLGLESKLVGWRNIYNVIPTLPPGLNWISNDDIRANTFKLLHDNRTNKTEKTVEYQTVAKPTDKHAAQVVAQTVNKTIGIFVEQNYSGMITPARKSELLQRIEELISAVKKARARANQTDIVKINIGDTLWKHINK